MAQVVEGEQEVLMRAKELLPHLRAMPAEKLEDLFVPAFLRQVPVDRLRQIHAEIVDKGGDAQTVRLVRMTAPYNGTVEFRLSKGFLLPTRLVLDAKPPHRITGLFFQPLVREQEDLGALLAEMKKLPGRVSVVAKRVTPSAHILADLDGHQPLAVGSTFKLVVLAALTQEIEQGKRRWSDVVTLRKEYYSLPGGLTQDWPEHAPVTLHTLATLMISRSDNTAADHLLFTLGRHTMEAVQERLGIGAGRNLPFLASQEMMKIKFVLDPAQQQHYVRADRSGRRKLLDSLIRNTSLSQPRLLTRPTLIDDVEWHYSAHELCSLIEWLTKRERDQQTLAILAINTGVPQDDKEWPYIGYKGGYEPGVLNLTFFLRHASGQAFALAMTWNRHDENIDRDAFFELTQRWIRWLGQQKPVTPP